MDIQLTPSNNSADTHFRLDLQGVKGVTSTILNGRIIQVQYALEVCLKVSNCRSNIVMTIPVVLGTINGGAPNATMQPQPVVPLVPVLRSESIAAQVPIYAPIAPHYQQPTAPPNI